MIVRPDISPASSTAEGQCADRGVSKRRYARSKDARRALHQMRAHGRGSGAEHYRCALCDGWHIGHPPIARAS